MPQSRDGASDEAEINDSALSFFETGMRALRGNDPEMARILLGVAEKIWEKQNDYLNAEKARSLSPL
jgi:hypothetical protein